MAKPSLEEYVPAEIASLIKDRSDKHAKWRLEECINLNAAESALSPLAQSLLSSDMTRRIVDNRIWSRQQKGSKYVDEVEALTTELARKLFHVEFAEFKFWGCSSANALSIRCLTEVGDTIFALEEPYGHDTYRATGYAGHRGLKILDIPYDFENFNIDLDRLRERAEGVKAKLLIVGSPVFLFPHDLKELAEIAQELGAKIMYDGAHVLGLIAGGKFQDPLLEGAFVLTGSTQKTLSGPVGGLILHNDSMLDKKIKSLLPGYQGAVGFDVPALAVTLTEMLEFGGDFATQIVRNAKALAAALDAEGFDVVGKRKGYTESHTIILDVERLGGGLKIAETLRNANIICTPIQLKPNAPPNGLRIGVTEMTRFGMKESETKNVASFISRSVIRMEDASTIAREIAQFRRTFSRVHFCFEA